MNQRPNQIEPEERSTMIKSGKAKRKTVPSPVPYTVISNVNFFIRRHVDLVTDVSSVRHVAMHVSDSIVPIHTIMRVKSQSHPATESFLRYFASGGHECHADPESI